MMGMAIAGWAFAFHYDNRDNGAGSQKELTNDLQTTKAVSSTLDHSGIILLLVSTGLIGFFGVRRKSKPLSTFVTNNRSKVRLRINLSTKDNLERQTCELWKTGCVAN